MGIRRFLGRVRRSLHRDVPRPSILMYHRVATLRHDPWGLAVDTELFERQMQYLREHRLPMAMEEIVEQLRQGSLPPEAVGVTFDDAYLDNLVHAKPSLVKYGIPATVFVPTGLVGTGVPFWWDELNTMLLDAPGAHRSEQMCGGEVLPLEWGPLEPKDGDPAWRGWDEPQTKRQHAYVALWSRMQKMDEAERATILASLRKQFQIKIDPLSLPMNHSQLQELLEGDLIRLGAHTVHHASLSDVSLDAGRAEVYESKMECASIAARVVDGFAYPYGNMTPEIRREVERAGYLYGCAAEAGFLDNKQEDLYALPRMPAPNLAGGGFAALLAG